VGLLIGQIKGWDQRGIYDEPRLGEIAKMYKELGFEIKIEPIKPELVPGCSDCMKSYP
jgi:hypothetical protein